MSSPKKRIYILGLCFFCQECLHCNKDCSYRVCKCNKQKKKAPPEIKKGQKRKYYSRIFQPNNSYNSWQINELKNKNEYYGYDIDFSEVFNLSLCSKCHSKFNRLGKKASNIQIETTSSSSTKVPSLSSSTKMSSSASSTKSSVLSLQDEELDIDFLTNETSLVELKFKLIIKFFDGKSYPAKWEHILTKDFYDFKNKLESLVQVQLEDQIIFQEDYITSYKYEKESGLGTQLANAKDWTEFLKEYEYTASGKKILVIIITIKKKPNKLQYRYSK